MYEARHLQSCDRDQFFDGSYCQYCSNFFDSKCFECDRTECLSYYSYYSLIDGKCGCSPTEVDTGLQCLSCNTEPYTNCLTCDDTTCFTCTSTMLLVRRGVTVTLISMITVQGALTVLKSIIHSVFLVLALTV